MRCTLELNPALCGGLCLLLDVLPLVRPRVGRLHYHSGEKSRSLGGSGLQDTRCTVWQALTTSAERLPDKVAVVDGGERITYSQLVERAGGLASALARLGIVRGDVVAIYMKNSIELVTVFYALQRLGVCVAWVNPDYREHEVRHILDDSGGADGSLLRRVGGLSASRSGPLSGCRAPPPGAGGGGDHRGGWAAPLGSDPPSGSPQGVRPPKPS